MVDRDWCSSVIPLFLHTLRAQCSEFGIRNSTEIILHCLNSIKSKVTDIIKNIKILFIQQNTHIFERTRK